MLSLESVGFYSDAPRSQTYPVGLGILYPATGNFVAFIGNVTSRPLVHRAIAAFRATNALPTIGAGAPNAIPGVGWSDHWALRRTAWTTRAWRDFPWRWRESSEICRIRHKASPTVAAWHPAPAGGLRDRPDRKSTRLNSSHRCISNAVFCLKKKEIHARKISLHTQNHRSFSSPTSSSY